MSNVNYIINVFPCFMWKFYDVRTESVAFSKIMKGTPKDKTEMGKNKNYNNTSYQNIWLSENVCTSCLLT